MTYLGDFRLGDTFDLKFTTAAAATGAPTTLAGTPVISAYPGNSTTQLTAGITLTVDFDAVTGLHNVRVVASSGNGYATATNYQLVITTGTVGGTSAVGYVIGQFSIENRSAVMPTTAARTLDVSATGEAGVDWANVGSPTTTVNMTGTKVTANLIEISGSTSDLAKFVSSLATAVRGTASTANAAGDSTHFRLSDYTEATASHMVGKQVWVTTGTLAGQWLGTVTAYALTSGEGAFTVSPGSPSSETLANGVIVYIV